MFNAIFALALMLDGSAPSACQMKDATFTDRTGAGYTIRFAAVGGELRAMVGSRSTGGAYQFVVTRGESYSAAHFVPTPAAVETVGVPMPVYAMAQDLSVQANFPGADDAAPRYIFVPELGQTLWYGAEALGGPRLAEKRESLPLTLFELSACGTSAAT